MRFNYNTVSCLYLYATCSSVSIWEHQALYEGTTRANKLKVDKLVKEQLPDLYESLALNYRNPYEYYKKKGLIILVHSSIDYFLMF